MYKDHAGERFGRLTALYPTKTVNGKIYWMCICDCGHKKEIRANSLTGMHTRSCGCLASELTAKRIVNNSKTHGKKGTRLYRIWKSMKTRCHNANSKSYKLYGGRNIAICAEWKNSFVAFYEWAISNGYADDLTIDRINTNGNYEPCNCKWATYEEQGRNRRNNVFVVYRGERMIMSEAVRRSGVSWTKLRKELLA